jgi:hypothetical protein
MVETSMASRKFAAQSSSNAKLAPRRDGELVIDLSSFFAAAFAGRLAGGRERENVQLQILLQIDSSHARYYQ